MLVLNVYEHKVGGRFIWIVPIIGGLLFSAVAQKAVKGINENKWKKYQD
jgi:hypothetical protein